MLLHIDQVVDFRLPASPGPSSGDTWPMSYQHDWAAGVRDGDEAPVRAPVHDRLVFRKRDYSSPDDAGSSSESNTNTSALRRVGADGSGRGGPLPNGSWGLVE